MWSIILPGANTLDFSGEIQFEVNSNIFSTSNTTKLEGTYTYPITLPASPKNRRLLNFPDLVNSATKPATFSNVWVYCLGHPMLSGRLTVRSANRDTIKCDIVGTPLRDMKDVKLRDLDLGGPRSIVPYANWELYMSAVANNPEDWDFTFFPVLAGFPNKWSAYFADENPSSRLLWHNYVTNIGTFDADIGAVTPFIKVEYLLNKMFEQYGSGFILRNVFQSNIELRRLYLFNNVDVRQMIDNEPALPITFDLRRHASEWTCSDLLKKLAALFNLGLFVNYRENTIVLKSVNDVINAAATVDWTKYQASTTSIEEWGSVTPSRYKHPEHEPIPISAERLRSVRRFQNLELFVDAMPVPEEWVYIEATGELINVTWYNSPVNGNEIYKCFIDIYLRPGNDTVYEPVAVMAGGKDYLESPYVPSRYVEETTGTDSRWIYQETAFEPGFMLYRGRRPEDDYPVASNHVWRSFGAEGTRHEIIVDGAAVGDAQEALDWQGPSGLYATRHAQWNEMLYNGKSVSMTLAVPISEFTRFTLDQKVRIENMDYIVRRMRIQRVDTTGVVFLQADMFTCV